MTADKEAQRRNLIAAAPDLLAACKAWIAEANGLNRTAAIKLATRKMALAIRAKTIYDCGYRARLRGCYRVLCDATDAERAEWLRGWDAADAIARAEARQ